jgi:hypothetical protein
MFCSDTPLSNEPAAMAKPVQVDNSWSREPRRPIHECAAKLDFFCLGRVGPNDAFVACKHHFWFRSRPDLAKALGIGPAGIKGSKIEGLSDRVLDLLGPALGFDARDPHFATKPAVEFAKWWNENNTYDGRFALLSANAPSAATDLRCVRFGRPQSKDRRLVTVELEDPLRNEATLPWPLHVGLTLGTRDVNGLEFYIRAGWLKFNLGGKNARTDLPGERKVFPGTLEITPKTARIRLRPGGDSFEPEWALASVGGPAGPITARELLRIHDLSPGDAITVSFTVFVRDLVPNKPSVNEDGRASGHGKTRAFVWKSANQPELQSRDAKSALLDHVEAVRLLHATDGEATLATDALHFVTPDGAADHKDTDECN